MARGGKRQDGKAKMAVGGTAACPNAHRSPIAVTTARVRRGVGGGRASATAAEKERGRQGSTCQTTTANIQTVAVRSGLGLCLQLQAKQISFAESQETVHFRTP